MLNVLHIITAPCGGGAEVLVRELVSRINDSEIQSCALFFNTKSPCAKNVKLASNEFSLDVGFKNPMAILLLRRFIKNKLEINQNLIVHAHLTWPMLYVPLGLIGLPVKIIFTEHATSNRRRKHPFLRYIERFIYGRFETIICISQGTKNALDSWIGKKLSRKTSVVLNGARLYSFKERVFPVNEVNLISIGSLIAYKGFDRTIRALAIWARKDWHYTIVGEGPDRADLELMIEGYGLSDKVKLIGWSDLIEEHLHNADVQLIPSRFEGFGLVAIEGMSTGLPVIASNVEGLNEVLSGSGSAGFLVNCPDSYEDWINALDLCLDKLSKNIEQIGNDARENATKFSVDLMAKNYESLYKSLG